MLPDKLNAFQGEEHQPFKYTVDKSGHAALLVHGFPGTPAEVRPIADILHQAGWTTQGVLLPGFGPQVETLPERTLDEWLSAIENALRDLWHDHDTVLLFGHSMGAALCIQVAANTPNKPDGLILFAPFWKVNHVLWTAMPVLKVVLPNPKVFKLLNLDFKDPETRKGIQNFMPDADLDDPQVQNAIRDFPVPVKMFAQIYKAGHMAYDLAPKIDIPTLVIQGKADELVRPTMTQQMVKRMNGKVSYIEVNGEHNLADTTLADWPMIQQYLVNFAHSLEHPLT